MTLINGGTTCTLFQTYKQCSIQEYLLMLRREERQFPRRAGSQTRLKSSSSLRWSMMNGGGGGGGETARQLFVHRPEGGWGWGWCWCCFDSLLPAFGLRTGSGGFWMLKWVMSVVNGHSKTSYLQSILLLHFLTAQVLRFKYFQ